MSSTQFNVGSWSGTKNQNQYNIYGTDGMVSAIFTGDNSQLKMANYGIVIGKTHDIGTVSLLKKTATNFANSTDYRDKEFKSTIKNVGLAAVGLATMGVSTGITGGILVEQTLAVSVIKTGISAAAQYAINDEHSINAVAALADGFLTTGSGSYLGAAFEVNVTSSNIAFKTAFSNEKSFSDFAIEGISASAFSKASVPFGNAIDATNLPSKALKESSKLLYESASQYTNYDAQKGIKEKINK